MRGKVAVARKGGAEKTPKIWSWNKTFNTAPTTLKMGIKHLWHSNFMNLEKDWYILDPPLRNWLHKIWRCKDRSMTVCLLRFQNKNLIMTDIQYSWLFRVRSTFNEGGYLSTGMGWKCNKYCGCVADPGSPSGVGRRMQTGEDWAPDVYSSLSFHWKKKDCVCKTNILVWQCWWNPLKTRDTPSFNLKITTYWKADFRYSSKREKELIW